MTRGAHLAVRVAAVLLAATITHAARDGAALDGFAAAVNGRIITVGDVMMNIQSDLVKLSDRYSGPELARQRDLAFRKGLDELIEQHLIVAEAERLKMTVPEKMVDDRINQVIYNRFGNDRAKFLAALASDRMTLEEWREETRERIVVSVLTRQEVQEKIKVSPASLKQSYEQDRDAFNVPAKARLSLIVLRTTEDEAARDAQREAAVRARGRILGGETFSSVAREVSQDSRAANGGDWGWVNPAELRAEIRDAVAGLKSGDLSEIIETPEALYLLRVEEKSEARVKSFDEVRLDVEAKLREAEYDRIYKRWIERLKRRFAVTMY